MNEESLVTIKLGGGVANRVSETKVPEDFVRIASNVDISHDGVVSRRDGYTKFISLSGARSVWSDPQISFGLVAAGHNLYRFDATGALTQLASNLSGADVHYCMTPIGVYWSDGAVSGNVSVLGVASPWGVETPIVTATPTANGALDPGTYAVSATFVDSNGQEGGAPSSQYVTLTSPGGIAVSVAQPIGSNVFEARDYVTAANGQELQYAGMAMPGATLNIDASPRGRPLRTQYMQPLPPLRYPAIKNGQLIGAVGRRLIWSAPLYYTLYNPRKGFTALRGQTITMVAISDAPGFLIYIGTDIRTYKFEGDSLENANLSTLSHVGVIPGSMARVAPDAVKLEGISNFVPVWVDKRGIPYAGVNGGLVQLHDKFAYPQFASTASTFDQSNGKSRYLVSGRGGTPSPLSFGDYVTAKVSNNGGGP